MCSDTWNEFLSLLYGQPHAVCECNMKAHYGVLARNFYANIIKCTRLMVLIHTMPTHTFYLQLITIFLSFFFLFHHIAGHMSWIMKLFIGLLLLVTFTSVLGNSSGGRKSRQNNGGTGASAANSIYTSLNHSITIVSNKTITHSTNLNVDLKHLVVDRNTGRVSLSIKTYSFIHSIPYIVIIIHTFENK